MSLFLLYTMHQYLRRFCRQPLLRIENGIHKVFLFMNQKPKRFNQAFKIQHASNYIYTQSNNHGIFYLLGLSEIVTSGYQNILQDLILPVLWTMRTIKQVV